VGVELSAIRVRKARHMQLPVSSVGLLNPSADAPLPRRSKEERQAKRARKVLARAQRGAELAYAEPSLESEAGFKLPVLRF
jgi:hypothetical protein